MLLLILAMALTNAQQAQHDHTEWATPQLIKADEVALSEIWRPHAELS